MIERPKASRRTRASRCAVEASARRARRRAFRGFELLSAIERAISGGDGGTEVRVTFIDKERGPLFAHEFHCLIDRTQLVYQCLSDAGRGDSLRPG
ncbi:MAG: hypothetical protein U0414_43525 [Polyangiaceae bacterium]